MPRASCPVNPMDDHAGNPPWPPVARHDDMSRPRRVTGKAEQGSGRPMAERGVRASPEQDSPQLCLPARLARENPVDALLHALPAPSSQ